jgi:TusA-related sulfurtransferase
MELIRIVRDAKVGDVLAVISSDEGSKKDIPAWLAKAKHELVGTEPVEGATRFICRKTH